MLFKYHIPLLSGLSIHTHDRIQFVAIKLCVLSFISDSMQYSRALPIIRSNVQHFCIIDTGNADKMNIFINVVK